MSDAQQQRAEQPDTSAPSAARQVELTAAYAALQDSPTPYKGVKIQTLGELQWIMQQRHWSGTITRGQPGGLPAGMQWANLSEAALDGANLTGAGLDRANLTGTSLVRANLSGVSLVEANLSGADLYGANLSGAKLMRARFDNDTALAAVTLATTTRLRDIRWNAVDLTSVNWEQLQQLGDDTDGNANANDKVRAYQQLATRLREQSINEPADRFAYRAKLWQRRIMRQRLKWTTPRSVTPYLGSLLLWAISGYGYRPSRTFLTYLLVIITFATGFYLIAQAYGPHLTVLSALVFSVTSFHGRGFFPGGIALDDPLTVAAAGEAMIGLLVEVTFIATFTQRFFAR